jgi:RNA polymerase sigma-70 factor (ECF subfamily)
MSDRTAEAHKQGVPAQEALLMKAQARDPEAWRLLLDLYGPVVHSLCRRSGLQFEDTADVVQDVFCSLMRQVGHFRSDKGSGSLRAWIWTITQNKLRDHFRRRARLPQAGGGEDAYQQLLSVPQPEPPGPPVARGQNETFHRALVVLRSEFEERTWLAFWRSVVDEQQAAIVGADLGMTPNAVRRAKCRVLKRLRQELGGPAGEA